MNSKSIFSFNQILESLILPLGDKILGNYFIASLKTLRKITSQSEEEIFELQQKKLHKLLTHATIKSSYYKDLNIESDENPVKWLKRFPILEKQILNQEQLGLLTQPVKNLIKQSSSGSSGVQSTVYWNKKEQSMHRATQILWWEWAGYKFGSPILQTGLSPKRSLLKAFKDKLLSTYYLFAFSFSKEEAIEALNWKKENKDRVLGGYASSLYVLSRYAAESKTDAKFKAVISWGDKLFDHYRKSIMESFKCKVYETYGTTEGMMIASQFDQPWLYIMTPNVFLELLDDDGNEVEDGELGHVVVTNLNGFTMPLIRYRIGDMAIKLPKSMYPVDKKLGLPLLQKVVGRDTDLVKTESGKYMTVHSFTGVFEYFPEIKQFCVIQENLKGVRIEYIRGKNFNSEILNKIKNQLLEFLKESFEIEFNEVEIIPPTKSGKPQIIISKLK